MTDTHFAATIDSADFKRALTAVARGIDKKAPFPIVQNVYMSADADRVHLTTTNLHRALTLSIPASVSVQGTTVLDPAALKSLTGTKQPIEIAVNGTAEAASGSMLVSVPSFDAADYPVIPQCTTEPIATIDAADLLPALAYVLRSVARDDTRPILTGVRMTFHNAARLNMEPHVRMESTDGFRMHFQDVGAVIHRECAVIVPHAALDLLVKTKPVGPISFTVRPESNQAWFTWDGGTLACRLIEGQYPNLAQIVPSRFQTTAMLDTAELRSFVTLASKARADAVTFEFAERVTASYRVDGNPTTANLTGVVDGAHLTMQFKPSYILDLLTAEDTTTIECTGHQSATKIGPAVVMPMHTNR